MDENFLIACVTLPMWFAPATIGGDRYIDAVYLTDANLIEAISKGADELWIMWTEPEGRMEGGTHKHVFPFQIIETSANGHLRRDLDRIKANNDAIRKAGNGEFNRPIKVEMLAAEVPLHYLINFRSSSFSAAVEQGVANARAWCRDRGLPLKPVS